MDIFSKKKRSEIMSKVRGKDTSPEIFVRKTLYAAGYRYRLHCKSLPGKPDIVLKKYNTVIFVHGCFWHGHSCAKGKRPNTNKGFWKDKLDKNISRDKKAVSLLKKAGWRVEIVWECKIRQLTERIIKKLKVYTSENPET